MVIGKKLTGEEVQIFHKKIMVFEYGKHTEVTDDAQAKEKFSPHTLAWFDHDASRKIYQDNEEQYQ